MEKEKKELLKIYKGLSQYIESQKGTMPAEVIKDFEENALEIAFFILENEELLEKMLKIIDSNGDLKELLNSDNYKLFEQKFTGSSEQKEIIELLKENNNIIDFNKRDIVPIDKIDRWTDILSKNLFKNGWTEGEKELNYILKKSKKEITIFYELKTPELFNNTSTKLDFFDGYVLEIAFNLLLAGNELFTTNQIAEVLTDGSINSDLLNKIENSLNKLRHTTITINNSDEAEKTDYAKIIGIDGYLFPCEIKIAEYRGKQFNAYKLLVENSLYLKWLIARKNQRTKIDIKHLKMKYLSLTKKNIEIRDYILNLIMHNRRLKRNFFTMRYETFIKRLTFKEKKDRIADKITKVLKGLKESGLIKDYEKLENFDFKIIIK